MNAAFAHDTAHAIDRLCNHVEVRHAVCRIPNPDPLDHDPLHFPEEHQPPEVRGLQARPLWDKPDAGPDLADRWIELTERALVLQYLLAATGDIEDALANFRLALR